MKSFSGLCFVLMFSFADLYDFVVNQYPAPSTVIIVTSAQIAYVAWKLNMRKPVLVDASTQATLASFDKLQTQIMRDIFGN
ncbi:MAG: hypothetical protein WCK42_03885 [Myxococcaceae bacterium]